MMGPRSPVAQRIDHVGIVVRDADAAAAYYCDAFGMERSVDVLLSDGSARLIYLEVGDTTLQLVQPLQPGPTADFLAERGEGLHHLCFAVSDLHSALESLPGEAHVTVSEGGRGAPVSFIRARPNGVTIELTGSIPESPSDPIAGLELAQDAADQG